MEGSWRGFAALLAAGAIGCAVAAAGCGEDESSAFGEAAVRTESPERTFAPLLEVSADEPWRPMSARWFIERSVLGMSDCGGARIAVGRTLPELRDGTSDWIFVDGLGASDRNYYRNYYDDSCDLDFEHRLYSDQLTRPHDPGPRPPGLPDEQGFVLDLTDSTRRGPEMGVSPTAPIYVERTDEGDSQVRLTYWMLYGMHGAPGTRRSHEGDWERFDVLLRADGDRYEPHTIQIPARPAAPGRADVSQLRDYPWSATHYVDGTHPVARVTPATHAVTIDPSGGTCADCLEWLTWEAVRQARSQLWYGFGGAWGEVGSTDATTGPLGPHGRWPTVAEEEAAGSSSG